MLSLDRVLGDSLHDKRALILVDIEGAEYMMLQGATNVLRMDPKPIWMMEISGTEHQPAGIAMNPCFAKTFELFFREGYRAFMVNAQGLEMTEEVLLRIVAGQQQTSTHNFVFRKSY